MNKRITYLFALLLLFSLLVGCAREETNNKPDPNDTAVENPVNPSENEEIGEEDRSFNLPVKFDNKGDHEIIGFFDDETIVYLTHYRDYSMVQTYSLINGENKELHTASEIIGQVILNEQLSNLLVISYPTSYEAKFTFINRLGEVVHERKYEAFDFEVKWNPYNENEILVTSFFEDWTFNTEVINIKENTTIAINTTQPFMFWVGNHQLAYIDYMEDVWSITGKLIVQTLNEETKKTILEDVYYVDTFKNQIFAITKEDATIELADYQMLNSNFEVISKVEVSQLSSYADWYIPNYESLGETKILTYKPYETGNLDEYTGGFELILIDKDEVEVVMEFTEPLPLLSSPNGKYTLVGYDYEKLVNLKDKTIQDLF